MSQFEYTPNKRYVAEQSAADRTQVRTAQSAVNRIESAYQQIVGWFGAKRGGRAPTEDVRSRSSVSQMLPPASRKMRKPWVISKLPA